MSLKKLYTVPVSEELCHEIEAYCKEHGYKYAEFFRVSAKEKMERIKQ